MNDIATLKPITHINKIHIKNSYKHNPETVIKNRTEKKIENRGETEQEQINPKQATNDLQACQKWRMPYLQFRFPGQTKEVDKQGQPN